MPELELLVILPTATRRVALPVGQDLVLGRALDCGVVVDDPSVSRNHALLRVGERVTLRDLGSANGTWLRGTRAEVTTARMVDLRLEPGLEVELHAGSSLLLGAVLLTLRGRVEARAEQGPVVVDPRTREVFTLAERVAAAPLNLLLNGETGTGKDELARAIHRASPRAAGPFVALNCAAMPESLLESELFGHEKGAFTGAHARSVGLIESANHGTLLLDEVGDMPLALQTRLLRVLEERAVRPVGGSASKPVDVRVVAATHRDLAAMCKRGEFRTDLYFRLNGMTLTLPPLRSRAADVMPLAQRFLERCVQSFGLRATPVLTPEAVLALHAHPWPGNVRELRNVIERAVALSPDGILTPEHLGLTHGSAHEPEPAAGEPMASLHDEVAAMERRRITEALNRAGGNQTRAAELLGISRRTLIARMIEWGMPRPRKG